MLLREHRREEHEHGADGAQRARQAAMTKAAALIDIARAEPRDKAVDGGKQIRRGVQQPDRPRMAQPVEAARFQRWADIVRRQQDEKPGDRDSPWPQNRPPQGDGAGSGSPWPRRNTDRSRTGTPQHRRRPRTRRKRERAVEGRRHIVHGKAPTQDLQQLRAAERDEVHQARDGKRKAVFPAGRSYAGACAAELPPPGTEYGDL